MDKLSAVYLVAGIILFLQVSISIGLTQNIRQTLTGQSAPESLTGTTEFSQRTNKRLTYIAGSILLLLILSYFVLPKPYGSRTIVAIMIGIAVLRVLSRPLLQLYEVRKDSLQVDDAGLISPWDFLLKFLPIWAISLGCSLSVLAGLYAATVFDSLAYLALGVVIAALFFFWELRSARRFVARFAAE